MLQDAFVFPVSFAQERFWLLNKLQPGSSSCNLYRCIRLFGRLSTATLEQSCAEIVRRHAALRTTFSTMTGQPVQVITPALSLPFRLLDLQELPVSDRQAEALRLATEEAFKPFDLVQGPLFRITVLRLAEEDHILLLTMHHIISDGWSMDVFLGELSTLYAAFKAAEPSPLPQLPIQYADHAVWQREWLQGDVLGEQLAYWKRQLAGALSPAELPADLPRPAGPPRRGAMHATLLPDVLLSSLEALSRREGVTLFMALLAAFQVLLQRLTGSQEISLGTPVAGRNRSEIEPLIGCFINTLVLRTDLSGNPTFSELLARARTVALGAYAHQDLPFERLVQELHPPRDLSRTPFFQVLFNGANVGRQELDLPGMVTRRLWLQEMPTGFDLTIYVREQREGTGLQVLYNMDLYGHQRMTQMLDQYLYLLEQVATRPHMPIRSYSLVTVSARPLLPDPSTALVEPSQELVADMIAKWAARAPGFPAIRQGNRDWSYQELASQATALAAELQARGLCKGTVIAVQGRPSFGLIASMLGVFLSGGILLTLDPELPGRRQQLLAQQAGAQAILLVDHDSPQTGWWQEGLSLLSLVVDPATARPRGTVPSAEADGDALPAVAPDDPAYIFFTSGTTGTPKGVLGCHKGLSHFLTWQRDTFAIGPGDLAAQLTTLSFDAVLRDIFTPLIGGATLCLRDESQDPGPAAMIRWLAQGRITMLHTVPTLAKFWLSRAPADISLPRLRCVFFAGEPLTDVLIRQWRAAFGSAAKVINLYGPTETTLAKCFYQIPAEPLPGVQPVGRTLPQTQALVLTEEDQLCGIGETGQIVLRTPFRTLGYIDAPQAEHGGFVRNPHRSDPADFLYYTGDLGRYRPDGTLDILGRLDDQVKIRGVRIEPAEVTATLARCSGVQDCIVIGRKNWRDEPYLAAYVVSSGDESVQASQLRSCLSAQLPAALVPEVFIFLDHLPLTARGKVDLEALPKPDGSEQVPEQSYIAPQTPVEEVVAGIFTDVLGVERVGVQDSFFALGGHSLLAMQIIFRISDALRTDLSLSSIFMAPTVAELSQTILTNQPQAEPIARALLSIKRMPAEERQRLLDQKRSEKG